jgi:hypothetical protein
MTSNPKNLTLHSFIENSFFGSLFLIAIGEIRSSLSITILLNTNIRTLFSPIHFHSLFFALIAEVKLVLVLISTVIFTCITHYFYSLILFLGN